MNGTWKTDVPYILFYRRIDNIENTKEMFNNTNINVKISQHSIIEQTNINNQTILQINNNDNNNNSCQNNKQNMEIDESVTDPSVPILATQDSNDNFNNNNNNQNDDKNNTNNREKVNDDRIDVLTEIKNDNNNSNKNNNNDEMLNYNVISDEWIKDVEKDNQLFEKQLKEHQKKTANFNNSTYQNYQNK